MLQGSGLDQMHPRVLLFRADIHPSGLCESVRLCKAPISLQTLSAVGIDVATVQWITVVISNRSYGLRGDLIQV